MSETSSAPGAGASVESSSAPSVVETATPITAEAPITPGETPNEATLDSATGVDVAGKITDEVSEKTAPGDSLKNIADGKTFTASQDVDVYKDYQKQMRADQADGDEPSIKPDENPVTFANVDEYKKNFAAVQADDINANTPPGIKDQAPVSSPHEADAKGNQPPPIESNQTPTDTKADVKEPPAENKKTEQEEIPENEFKTPRDIQNEIQNQKNEKGDEKKPDGERADEKDEDPKSEQQKQIEEKMQMADIVSQIKDINPRLRSQKSGSARLS